MGLKAIQVTWDNCCALSRSYPDLKRRFEEQAEELSLLRSIYQHRYQRKKGIEDVCKHCRQLRSNPIHSQD